MPTSVIVAIFVLLVLWILAALCFWSACVLAKRHDRDMGIDD